MRESRSGRRIPGTQLLYITNTVAHVFKELTREKIYVLISGRWFRSASFNGPWEYVPGAALPRDFADIPDDSPQENVKASVLGTPQAVEAAIANAIPSTVKVDRAKAVMDPPPQYDGSPRLEPIDRHPAVLRDELPDTGHQGERQELVRVPERGLVRCCRRLTDRG